MEILTGKIGCGKTVALIKKAFDQKLTVVVRSELEVLHYKQMCEQLELTFGVKYTTVEIISFHNFCTYSNKDKNYCVDGIEHLLEYLFPTLKIFTCEGESVTVLKHENNKFFNEKLF